MYGVIYDWFITLFVGDAVGDLDEMTFNIGGYDLTAPAWLAHTATIIVLAVLCFVAFKFVWWLVRLVANGFSMRA